MESYSELLALELFYINYEEFISDTNNAQNKYLRKFKDFDYLKELINKYIELKFTQDELKASIDIQLSHLEKNSNEKAI